jgi:hypothetical protein
MSYDIVTNATIFEINIIMNTSLFFVYMIQMTIEMHYLGVRVDRLTAETSEPIPCFVF